MRGRARDDNTRERQPTRVGEEPAKRWKEGETKERIEQRVEKCRKVIENRNIMRLERSRDDKSDKKNRQQGERHA